MGEGFRYIRGDCTNNCVTAFVVVNHTGHINIANLSLLPFGREINRCYVGAV